MRTYQKVGLIGGIITLVVSALFSFVSSYLVLNSGTFFSRYMPQMARYGGMLSRIPFGFFLGIAIIGVIAGILGIIGAGVSNRTAGGVLLIIGAIMSLTVAFGIFGIGFILMLVGGILGLAGGPKREERTTTVTREQTPPPPPAAPPAS